jgi:hypothetical protein
MSIHRASGHLRAFVADLRRQAEHRDGTFDAEAYEIWRRRHAGAAHRFPHVWRLLDTPEKARHVLDVTRERHRDAGGALTPDQQWTALTMTGLGVMDSQSPTFGGGIAQGAQAGMNYANTLRQANAANELAQQLGLNQSQLSALGLGDNDLSLGLLGLKMMS